MEDGIMSFVDLPQVHFGEVKEDEKPVDWRKAKDDSPDDDGEDQPASDDVKAVLGFDPDEIDKEKEDAPE
jgi:hypothetical protein